MQTDNRNISVIICSYNREKVIGKTLQHLSEQIDKNFEIVLVNNNSTDRTETICLNFIRENPHLTVFYVLEKNQGLSYARNRGVKEAHGEYLVFLDDDAFAFPDYIRNLKAFLNNYPETKAAGGKILPCFESRKPDWMSPYLMSLISTLDLGNTITLFSGRSYPIGANMLIHKTVFEQYGYFDVNLGRKGKNLDGAEEKDLFLRIKKAGIPIYYIPDLVIEHWAPDSRLTDEFFTKQALAIGSSEKIRAKNSSSAEYLKSCLRELFKWGATFVLFAGYTFTGQYIKGAKLVEFRWKVSKGLFG
ncbi:MAG: glycosyltransferase [Dysgonamonadaceae bacterium]|jgi:glycosyltransferase involved in cell wall biosynthesis|nr:glycosyltransferase [Dysgonamonadaceae bacterium]